MKQLPRHRSPTNFYISGPAIYMWACEKIWQDLFQVIYSIMDPEKKKKYYQENRERRLAYQKEYYRKNKNRIKRKKELKQANDPSWIDKQREYNRQYYIKNRERIQQQRAEKAGLWAGNRSEICKTAQRLQKPLRFSKTAQRLQKPLRDSLFGAKSAQFASNHHNYHYRSGGPSWKLSQRQSIIVSVME